MIIRDIEKGHIKVSDGLEFYPGYTFEQFKKTKYYNGQNGIRTIYLDGTYEIYQNMIKEGIVVIF